MSSQTQIDATDILILNELISNSRKKVKDIAKKCNLSATAVSNRIARLKAEGVIKGTALFIDMNKMGFMFPASFGLNVKPQDKAEVLRIIKSRVDVISVGESEGNSNLTVFFIAKSLNDINNLRNFLTPHTVSGKVTVGHWKTPHFVLENVKLQPTRA
jgi:Lrp/AsnC family leucine-responsive transcriptional regulator